MQTACCDDQLVYFSVSPTTSCKNYNNWHIKCNKIRMEPRSFTCFSMFTGVMFFSVSAVFSHSNHFLFPVWYQAKQLNNWTSSDCSATVWDYVLPDQLADPPSTGGLPAPLLLLPSHSFCFVHWTRCPLRKVINHNYLICWQSPSHSSTHSLSPSSLLLFNFTRDQCCCQAIYLFIVVPQT